MNLVVNIPSGVFSAIISHRALSKKEEHIMFEVLKNAIEDSAVINEKDGKKEETLKKIAAVADIPKDKNFFGKEYKTKCPCGGEIIALRSATKGHLIAKCKKCGFTLME